VPLNNEADSTLLHLTPYISVDTFNKKTGCFKFLRQIIKS